jgi:hypothetical protein
MVSVRGVSEADRSLFWSNQIKITFLVTFATMAAVEYPLDNTSGHGKRLQMPPGKYPPIICRENSNPLANLLRRLGKSRLIGP